MPPSPHECRLSLLERMLHSVFIREADPFLDQ